MCIMSPEDIMEDAYRAAEVTSLFQAIIFYHFRPGRPLRCKCNVCSGQYLTYREEDARGFYEDHEAWHLLVPPTRQ